MLTTIKQYYRPLYHNSIAEMLDPAFAASFGLLFWIVAVQTVPSKRSLGLIAMGRLD